MRRVMRAAAAVTFLTGVTAAAVADPPAAPGVFVPWANKFFQKENTPAVVAHDFGTVPHGTLLTHKFTLTNIYDVPVQVIDVRKSCTCLEAYPPPQVLQPNESAEFVVTMNAAKFSGPNAQTFFVTFGPQFVSTAVVRVQANSRADVTLTPGQVDFGVVAQGAALAQVVGVKYTGRQRDWAITGVVPPAGPLDVQVAAAGGHEFRVTVALKPTATGTVNEPVTLRTNDPSAPLLHLNVTAAVQAPVSVSPNRVRFEKVKVGEEQAVKVMVRATKPFRVRPVADDGDGLSAEAFPGPLPVQIVTVKFAPKAAGAVRKEIRFATDLPGGPTAVLAVEADAVP